MTLRSRVSLVVTLTAVCGLSGADEPAKLKDTQKETVRLTTPEEARAAITAPEGFRVSLFAAEPDVRNPIAVTTDTKGRLWVSENFTYAESALNFDLSQHDRIV